MRREGSASHRALDAALWLGFVMAGTCSMLAFLFSASGSMMRATIALAEPLLRGLVFWAGLTGATLGVAILFATLGECIREFAAAVRRLRALPPPVLAPPQVG